MNPVTVMKVGAVAYKHRKTIISIVLTMFFLFFAAIALVINSSPSGGGTANVNSNVEVWRPVVEKYAQKYDIPEYVDVALSIMMVESGGNQLDIMQSSESLGLPPNSITDPEVSIDVGMKHLASTINNAKNLGLDFWAPVQSYNYGSGFNNFVASNGKAYSFELATEFAKNKSGGKKVTYSNPIADFNGNWRFQYGNMYYVRLIQQYISSPGAGDIGNINASPIGAENYQKLMTEVLKYNGWPYQWGGSNPNTSFDCSGLLQYNYRLIGYNLPRTALEQYNATTRITDPQPGDLIFFKGTYGGANHISHVGIYIDSTRMFDASSSGVGYSTWNSGYWSQYFAGFGRVGK